MLSMLWFPWTEISFVSALTQPVSFQHLICAWDCVLVFSLLGWKIKSLTSAFFISLLRYCFSLTWDLVTDLSPPRCKNYLNASCLDPENIAKIVVFANRVQHTDITLEEFTVNFVFFILARNLASTLPVRGSCCQDAALSNAGRSFSCATRTYHC